MVVIRSIEGVGCSRDGGQVSTLSLLVMMTLRRKTGMIAVMPHVENGGCMKMEAISNLEQAVWTDVSVRQGW